MREELIHSFQIKQGLLDLTPGDGSLALVAVAHGLCYVAIAWTEDHMKVTRS